MSAFYLVVCRLLELIVLSGRADRAKELEILVLRHELSILRRQVNRPHLQPHDRLLLAAFSRCCRAAGRRDAVAAAIRRAGRYHRRRVRRTLLPVWDEQLAA